MLYVYFGKEVNMVRKKAIEKSKELASATDVVKHISAEEYVSGIVRDACESASLFGDAQVFLVDTPKSDALFKEELENALEMCARSRNHFVVIEGELLVKDKKAYTAYAHTIEESTSHEKKSTFNIFVMCDAFLERDKKKLWLLLMESEHVVTEEIAGVLFWQIKLLRLAERTHTPEEAGQKPFSYNKAKRALVNFKKGEVDAFSYSLTQLYHDGHGGKIDMRLGLERWILSI